MNRFEVMALGIMESSGMSDQQQLEILLDRWEEAQSRGHEPSLSELCRDYPELEQELSRRVRAMKGTGWMFEPEPDSQAELDFLPIPPDETISRRLLLPESISLDQFKSELKESGLLDDAEWSRYQATSAEDFVAQLLKAKKLTEYQVNRIADGETRHLVLGNYVVLDKIGAGGMGQVFQARHVRMDRVVALKILPPESRQFAVCH